MLQKADRYRTPRAFPRVRQVQDLPGLSLALSLHAPTQASFRTGERFTRSQLGETS